MNQIERIRTAKRITRRALAARARIQPARLGQIVNGHIAGRPDERQRIAAALRVPAGDIFSAHRE